MAVTQDKSVEKLFQLQKDYFSLDNTRKTIKQLEQKQQSLANQKKTIPSQKLRSDFYNHTYRLRRMEYDRITGKKKNIKTFQKVILNIIFYSILLTLLYFFIKQDWFSLIKDWIMERWWINLLKPTPKNISGMYYFSIGLVSLLLFLWLITVAWDVDRPLSIYLIIIFGAFEIYCLIMYFSSVGFLLGLVIWIAYFFIGLLHWIVFGTLGLIPYLLLISPLVLPVLSFRLKGLPKIRRIKRRKTKKTEFIKPQSLKPTIDEDTLHDFLRLDYDLVTHKFYRRIYEAFAYFYESEEYKKAILLDQKEAPKLYEGYLKHYEEEKNAIIAYNNTIDRQIQKYISAINELRTEENRLCYAINSNNVLLYSDDKNPATVNALVYYIKHQRANTVQEALNLLDNERRLAKQEERIGKFMQAMENELDRIKQQQEQQYQNLNRTYNEFIKAERETQKLIEQQNAAITKASESANSYLASINADMEIARHQRNSHAQSIEAELYHIKRNL